MCTACWPRLERTSYFVFMSILFLTFLCLQFSFYSTFVDSLADHTYSHSKEEGSAGSIHFLRPAPSNGIDAETGSGIEPTITDVTDATTTTALNIQHVEYEYISLGLLQQVGAVQMGLVVRAHAGYAAALISLLWSLQAQDSSDSDPAPHVLPVVVVPTEPGSAAVLRDYIEWYTDAYLLSPLSSIPDQRGRRRTRTGARTEMGAERRVDLVVAVMDPNTGDFEAQSHVLAGLCTKAWRKDRLAGGYPASALNRYCSVNSPIHYHLTDMGLKLLLTLAPQLPFLVVTNADNSYSPRFMSATLNLLEGGQGQEQCDVVLVDMVHRGQVIQVKPELGHMDLGCVVIRTSTLFPAPAQAQSDFWFIDTLLNRHKARLRILREILFIHN